GDALGLPILQQALHIGHRVLLALDEDRLIADLLLLLGDAGHLLMHDLGADLHIAQGVIAEGLRIALPDGDAVGHEAAHGRLVVVVADDPAGDARGPGPDTGLVDDQYVLAAAAPGFAQRLAQ